MEEQVKKNISIQLCYSAKVIIHPFQKLPSWKQLQHKALDAFKQRFADFIIFQCGPGPEENRKVSCEKQWQQIIKEKETKIPNLFVQYKNGEQSSEGLVRWPADKAQVYRPKQATLLQNQIQQLNAFIIKLNLKYKQLSEQFQTCTNVNQKLSKQFQTCTTENKKHQKNIQLFEKQRESLYASKTLITETYKTFREDIRNILKILIGEEQKLVCIEARVQEEKENEERIYEQEILINENQPHIEAPLPPLPPPKEIIVTLKK